MKFTKDLLVITASNGENLKLAEKFVRYGQEFGAKTKLIDLTSIDLPLYNPRTHSSDGVPSLASKLGQEMASYSKWVICAPEYNGSIPPVFTSTVAWLSVEGEDFRKLFNGRPIAIASFSGGGGMALLTSLRIQLSHLGAQVLGRQLMSNSQKPAQDQSIKELLALLMQMEPLRI